MSIAEIEAIIEQLRNREIREYRVSKEEFAEFRAVVVKQPDFKHFRGRAQRGGDVIYEYMEVARS